MAMGSGLIALAVLAADGTACPAVETTSYQVRILTMDGLDWRTAAYPRLQPAGRQGMATIWTADRSTASLLAERSKASGPCHKITAIGEAMMTKAEPVHYVGSMVRVADGPINQSSAIAFMPRPEQVEERFSIKVSGRKIDQGILARISLEESHVDVIHGVPQTETLVTSVTKPAKGPTDIGREMLNVVLASASSAPSNPTSITSSVQIPEITTATVDGEWLIPNDGVLLVSLGVKTAADDKGMAVVRERLAVIEANVGGNFPGPMTRPAAAPAAAAEGVTRLDAKFEPVAAQPALPARSMPQPVDPDGKLTDLPPLPEALASTDLDRIKPEPNQPSPQAPHVLFPSTDPALARTGFDAAPPAPNVPNPGADAAMNLLGRAFDALDRAGFGADINLYAKDLPRLKEDGDEVEASLGVKDGSVAKVSCDKCDADATFCPADGRSMKAGLIPGGIRLVSESMPRLGVTIDKDGVPILEGVAEVEAAFRMPGKTETILVPLWGNLSLELKATVVPTPAGSMKSLTSPAPAEKDKKGETASKTAEGHSTMR